MTTVKLLPDIAAEKLCKPRPLIVGVKDVPVMRKTQWAEKVRGIALLMPLSGRGRNPLEQCAKLVMHLRTRTRGVGFVMRMQEVFGFR